MLRKIFPALNDIFNYRTIILFTSIILFMFTLFIVVTLDVLVDNIKFSNSNSAKIVREYQSFSIVPTSLDISGDSAKVENLVDIILDSEGYTFLEPFGIERIQDRSVTILIGDGLILGDLYKTGDKLRVVSNVEADAGLFITIQNRKLQIEHINDRDSFINRVYDKDNPRIYIVVSSNELIEEFVNFDNPYEAYSIIENALIPRIKTQHTSDFLSISNSTSLTVGLRNESQLESELDFVLKFNIPLTIFNIGASSLMFYEVSKVFAKKNNKNYSLHLLYGATIEDIYFRILIVIITPFTLVLYMFLYLSKFNLNSRTVNAILVLVMIFLLVVIIQCSMLNKIGFHEKRKTE